jgi:hypothetical protein
MASKKKTAKRLYLVIYSPDLQPPSGIVAAKEISTFLVTAFSPEEAVQIVAESECDWLEDDGELLHAIEFSFETSLYRVKPSGFKVEKA